MSRFFPKVLWARILVSAAYVAIAGAALYFGGRPALRILWPFFAAAIIAAPLRKLVNLVCRRSKKLPRTLVSAVFSLILFTLIGLLIYFVFRKVYIEAKALLSSLISDPSAITNRFNDMVEALLDRFPALGEKFSAEQIKAWTGEHLLSIAVTLSAKLPSIAANFALSIPEILLIVVIIVMSTIYLAAAKVTPTERLLALLPDGLRERFNTHRSSLITTGKRYLRGLCVMLALTFVILSVGFLFLRVKYALLWAAVVAVLDMLPVIGIGAILIPWAVWELIIGNYYLGFGLIILFFIATVIREGLEPKIIGGNIGLSALATMFSMWCGFCILGVAGLIVGPIAAVIIVSARGKPSSNRTKTDLQNSAK